MNLIVQKSKVSTATISKDGRYCYKLTRRWADGGQTAVWVMLFPGVADAKDDDSAIRRCIGLSQGFGASALVVVNLFALRVTDQKKLLQNPKESIGPRNVQILEETLKGATRVIAGWGALQSKLWTLSLSSREVLRKHEKMQCFGKTKQGAPRHPLYVKSGSPLVNWP